ncbi:hypothetical protein niasHT_011975 [Heterodera trifolii]|uniref:Peptidase S1 domain-containing protein n=1 Tax=Heterodera trifolii TaxID=157864 RepID=A0ABD2LK83_9BILA
MGPTLTLQVSKANPWPIQVFYRSKKCSSFWLCYNRTTTDKGFPWKLKKGFRFDKLFNVSSESSISDQCGPNARKIHFSIANETLTIGNELITNNAKQNNTNIELKFDPFCGNVVLLNNDGQEQLKDFGKEFFAQSNYGPFLADYAGLWLLPLDIVPKLGGVMSDLISVVPDECKFDWRLIDPPKQCMPFDFEAAQKRRSARRINPLVYGGTKMDINLMPWTVFYKAKTVNGSEHCSGSLISSEFVLLAAHCVQHLKDGTKIVLGFNSSERIKSKQPYHGIQLHLHKSPSNVFIHPGFVKKERSKITGWNDLALIKLNSTELMAKLPKVCLHCGPIEKFYNKTAQIAGWGKISKCVPKEKAISAPYLIGRSVQLSECRKLYRGDRICLRGIASQSGDSGSAILASNGTDYVQIAVSSYVACVSSAPEVSYAIYSRIDAKWLEKISGIRCNG